MIAMFIRITLFLVMALGLLGFGAVTWVSAHPQGSASGTANAAAADIGVVVAEHAMRPGSLLKSDDLKFSKIPATDLPESPLRQESIKLSELNGNMLRRAVRAGEPLLKGDILHPNDRGFLAAVLAPGMRAISVAVDVVTGTAGLIWPGDHVDVLLTQSIDDPARPLGMRVAAHTVLGDIRVIAIDQKLDAGATPDGTPSKPATTVTLEVTGEQAERVVVAGRIGKLSLVVRSAEASNVSENPNHVTWGSDVSPAMAAAPLPNAPNAETLNSTVRVHRGSADAKEFHF